MPCDSNVASGRGSPLHLKNSKMQSPHFLAKLNRNCQFTLRITYILAEEIETLRYVCEPGFFCREFQSPSRHEIPDRREYVRFKHLS